MGLASSSAKQNGAPQAFCCDAPLLFIVCCHTVRIFISAKSFSAKKTTLYRNKSRFLLCLSVTVTQKSPANTTLSQSLMFPDFFIFCLFEYAAAEKKPPHDSSGKAHFCSENKKCAYRSKRTKNANSDSRQTNPVQKTA